MPTKSDNQHLRVVAAMSGGVDSAVAAAIFDDDSNTTSTGTGTGTVTGTNPVNINN